MKIYSRCGKLFLLGIIVFMFATNPSAANLLEAKIETAFNNNELEGLHAVLVLRKGEVVAEKYFPGHDERWGASLGRRYFDHKIVHDLRSVTKSITSLLYGIALSEGLVPDPDSVLMEHFSEYADLAKDAELKKIKIRHVLSMMMGLEWDETVPYTSEANSEIAMELAPDRYRFILSRPILHAPGEVWTYSGGATALIAHLIETGADKDINAYAQEKLFGPLGIEKVDWVNGLNGRPSAASGLRLTARDLAKIGVMLVNKGKYEDQQIVPSEWIAQSFLPNTDQAEGLRYGYFWWLSPEGDPPRWAAGFGNGGQRLTISQQSDFVIVIFAGNYNKRDAWRLPVKLITEMIVPALF